MPFEAGDPDDVLPSDVTSDPLANSVSGAGLGEVELLHTPEGVAVSVVPRSVGDVTRAVGLASRLGARVAVTRRVRPGLLALDLRRLDELETPDEKSCLVRVGAGASVAAVEAKAIQYGLTLGPLLPSSSAKTVGAWLAGPTRGERAIPGARLETAALALEAVLADCSLYRSKETPRSATGPDLDHLLLGGEGRFGVLTRATLRLFPRALVEAASAVPVRSAVEAIDRVRRAVHEGLAPAEARWDRARATVEARFTGSGAAARARRFGPQEISGREIRGHLELAGSWKAWAAATPLRFEVLQLVAIHADGAFGALQFDDPDEADRAAQHARAIGFVVASPRRLRASPDTGWGAAGGLFRSLCATLDPHGVFER